MFKALLCGVALLAATTLTAHAQTAATEPSAPPAASAPAAAPAVAAVPAVEGRSLIGMKVQTEDNAHIGRINNVVVNKDGYIDYAVVKVSGFLGLGSKKVTVAWNDLRVDDQRGIVRIGKTKEQLMSEPEFREAPKAATG
ncbi:MAG: PRC-barrel domain-containing protein [Alphaproteobacteria bacterium]